MLVAVSRVVSRWSLALIGNASGQTIAVLTSLWPMVFITAARFPVLFSTRVP